MSTPLRPIDAAHARRFAGVALHNVTTPYPYHLGHFARGPDEIKPPTQLHPVFWGSYDWHSCAHMHWTLARCRRGALRPIDAAAIDAHFDVRFTPDAVAGELAYVSAPGRASFERPYGWAWVLKLAAEFEALAPTLSSARRWAHTLAPLAQHFAERFIDFLPRADYATRAGSHGNSAFALNLALDYAGITQHRALAQAIAARAQAWFGRDRRYPAEYEPSGDDFLSPGLCEALLMARTVPACDFGDWWEQFAPKPAALARWLTPVAVSDASDPKIVHLHGLNLSRAWCWFRLSTRVPEALREPVAKAIEASLACSLPAAVDGHYVGTHWLASFALLALTEPALDDEEG